MAGHAGRQTAVVFHRARQLPALAVAGLWDEWRDRSNGETLKSCTVIITKPNKFVGKVHDRMPVLLSEKAFELWLSGAAGLTLERLLRYQHFAHKLLRPRRSVCSRGSNCGAVRLGGRCVAEKDCELCAC